MAELVAACALVALLLLGALVAAVAAVAEGGRVGTPASVAVIAPLADAARLLRSRSAGGRRLPLLAGGGLLAATALRVLALPLAGAPLLGVGYGWLVGGDLLWWGAAALLVGRGELGRHLRRAAAIEAPLLVALATPALAAGTLRIEGVRSAQRTLPFAAEAPIAFLVLLVCGGVLLPGVLAVRGTGTARLLSAAARWTQPVSAAAVAAVLLLGSGGSPGGSVALAVLAALLAGIVAVVAGRFPTLQPQRLAELAVRVLLPLALVQLGVVAVLRLLGA